MKKTFIIVLVLAAIALSALGFAACNICEHAVLEHHKEIAASCETEGRMEYWFCIECGQYFEDELATKKITYSKLTIPVLGHDLQDVEEVSQTCTEPGSTAGQKCSRCGYTTVWTIPASHDMTHHAEIPATCTEDGTKEHWTCSREDGVYYADEAGKTKLNDITISAMGHDMTHHDGISATCTEEGVSEHWICSREDGVYYADEDGAETLDNLTTSATGHAMEYVEMQPATCMEDGYIAHWACAHEEGVYYVDEKATETIDSSDIILAAIGHAWNEDKWLFDETYHWRECNNGCGEQGYKTAHSWNEGTVDTPATTQGPGQMHYNCEFCEQTKIQILPRLGTFSFNVIKQNIYNNEEGGSINWTYDRELENGFCVEGTVITVTITLNDSFGIGSIYVNDEELVYSPLATNGVYTFDYIIKEHTTLTVELGKTITLASNRVPWNLRDGNGRNFAYPWEYYTIDAAQDGNGTAILYVYDATGIEDVRNHDFTADDVFYSRELYQTLSWDTFDKEIYNYWIELIRNLPDNERKFEFTLAFAIRLFPSEAKHTSGYVATGLILPAPTTVGGVDYDMTADYSYSKADLTAPNDAQLSINAEGTAFEFLKVGNRGSVFTSYNAAYIEIEMSKGDVVRYAYLIVEDGQLYMYSDLNKSETRLALSAVNNAWIRTNEFDSWAAREYPDANISATGGWEFRTKVHVDENSSWLFDSEWSEVVKYGA